MIGYIREGYCQCGCGERTTIAHRNRKDCGWIKGKPKPYIHGHNSRKASRGVVVSEDGSLRLPLARRDGTIVAYALLDPEDAHLGDHCWHLSSRGYAVRGIYESGKKTKNVLLHREVLALPYRGGDEVDHINRDKLDNRRSNLRVVTHAENEQNKVGVRSASGYRHVTYQNGRGWMARVIVNGKPHIKGYFPTPEEAAVHAEALRRRWQPCRPS